MKSNRDGTPSTQGVRHATLMEAKDILQENYGYSKHWKIQNFGDKEVHRLVGFLKESGISDDTIRNKVSHYRWINTKVGHSPINPSNKHFGLNVETQRENKAMVWDQSKIDKLDERTQLVNELKYHFGAREEEALKIRPNIDIKHDRIDLKITKGNRPRSVPMTTPEQRDLAKRVLAFHARHPEDKSMIPAKSSYNTYRHHIQRISASMGVKGHGYRHAWAHNRFEQLSGGIKPSIAGGPEYKSLNGEERARWDKAAKVVNLELGHGEGRYDITATYIGGRS